LWGIVYKAAVILTVVPLAAAPAFYILFYVFSRWQTVMHQAFSDEVIGAGYWNYTVNTLGLSIRLTVSAVLIDLALGIPLSYLLARGRLPFRRFFENLALLPLVVPTSAFGFSLLVTWSSPVGVASLVGLGNRLLDQTTLVPIIQVPALLLITHVVLSLPFIIKPLVAVFESIEESYEIVSGTLGASTLTTFRYVVLPLSLPSIISSSILAFTRSLGETGATMIVAGVSVTASVAIVRLTYELKLELASLLAALLVLATLALLLPSELLLRRRRKVDIRTTGIGKTLVAVERSLSSISPLSKVFKAVLASSLVVLVAIPIIILFKGIIEYWHADPYTGKPEGGVSYQMFGPAGYAGVLGRAFVNSLLVASLSTLFATYMSILLFTVSRRSRLAPILRNLVRIPLMIPTSVLGFSSLLLLGERGLNLMEPGIWLTIVVHTSLSVPLIYETLMATYESMNVDVLDETARTLGATPYDSLETVVLPLLKRGIASGALLAFARSLGETGATMLVMGRDMMVPILVVNMAEALAVPAAMFTSSLLIVIALALFILSSIVAPRRSA